MLQLFKECKHHSILISISISISICRCLISSYSDTDKWLFLKFCTTYLVWFRFWGSGLQLYVTLYTPFQLPWPNICPSAFSQLKGSADHKPVLHSHYGKPVLLRLQKSWKSSDHLRTTLDIGQRLKYCTSGLQDKPEYQNMIFSGNYPNKCFLSHDEKSSSLNQFLSSHQHQASTLMSCLYNFRWAAPIQTVLSSSSLTNWLSSSSSTNCVELEYKLVDDKHPRLAVTLDPGPDTRLLARSPFIVPPEVPSWPSPCSLRHQNIPNFLFFLMRKFMGISRPRHVFRPLWSLKKARNLKYRFDHLS